MGRKLKEQDHKASLYFKLNDETSWEILDKLMTIPKYEKSRTRLINEALQLGLPKIAEREFNEPSLLKEEKTEEDEQAKLPVVVQTIPEERVEEIIRLLEELVINSNISESILCSLFNIKCAELKDIPPRVEKVEKGGYKSTPDYLLKYEIDALKDIAKKRGEW